MSDFRSWEKELGPEVTGIGKSSDSLSHPELEARIDHVERLLLDAELEAVESGERTPEELAEEARISQEFWDQWDNP